jgi:hypothetical protein
MKGRGRSMEGDRDKASEGYFFDEARKSSLLNTTTAVRLSRISSARLRMAVMRSSSCRSRPGNNERRYYKSANESREVKKKKNDRTKEEEKQILRAEIETK